MRLPDISKVVNKLKNLSKKHKLALFCSILLIQLAVTAAVYLTGGIQFVYSHSMYIPIILAALVFGHKVGLFFAIIGGLLVGPFMPIDTSTGLMQEPVNWIYRMLFFSFVGFVLGYFSEHTNKYYLEKIRQLTYLDNTDIYKSNMLFEHVEEISNQIRSSYYLVTLRINNRENLIDIFGTEAYLMLLSDISSIVHENLKDIIGVYSRNTDGLIVFYHEKYHDDYMKALLKISQKSYEVLQVQIFIQMTIGLTKLSHDLNESINQSSMAAFDALEENREFKYYSGEVKDKSRNIEILGSVMQSLTDGDFHLVYQPKIDLKTKKYVGAECLIRWKHPKYGELPPLDFIGLIENTNLINSMTLWVIDKVISDLNSHKDVYDATRYPIAINLSTANLTMDHDLYKDIIERLNNSGLGKNFIQFEITESLLMKNPKESVEVIRNLQANHVSFAIDDFGTGFSSLEYLSQFAVKEIKIDRTFISKMLSTEKDLSLVKATINIAKALKIKTVAEGVENIEESKMLNELKCDYAQGYYFAKPMTFNKLIDFSTKIETSN